MGVTVLHAYPVPADKTAPQVVELIHKRIVNLGSNITGQFLVDCETYFSSPNLLVPGQGTGNVQAQKTLHVLHNSEHPATVFSVLESQGSAQASNVKSQGQQLQGAQNRITFTSDTLFDILLLKLSSVYQKKLKIESKGNRYEIGDFVVKLGIVSVTGSVKGILVEVEYLPCVVVQSCWSLIIEFMQGFLGSVISSQIPTYLRQKSEQTGSYIYSPSDTAHQYLEHFANFRKAGGPSGNSTNAHHQNLSVPNR